MTIATIEAINRVWNEYNINGVIRSENAPKLYTELYKILQVPSKERLAVIQEFASSNPKLPLTKADIDYLHQRLLGESIDQVLQAKDLQTIYNDDDGIVPKEEDEEGDDDDDDDDACKVLYSPHKKTPKVVPIIDGKNDIARNLFDAGPVKIDDDVGGGGGDLTRDIFNDKQLQNDKKNTILKSSLKNTNLSNELDNKRSRIVALEKVLVEMQEYISKLNDYNDKEIMKIKSKYETKITECELKINEISKSIKLLELQNSTPVSLQIGASEKLKSLISKLISIIVTYKIGIIIIIIIGAVIYNVDKIVAVVGNLRRNLTMWFNLLRNSLNLTDEDQALDKTLKEFSHLIEIVS